MSAPAPRPAGDADAPAIAALHAASFDPPWSADAVRSLLALASTVALVVDAPPGMPLAGYVLIQCAADEAEILSIAVAAGCRHRGLGRLLLTAALACARDRGARRLFLEVADDNGAAVRLYRRAGFAEAGRRKAYYRHVARPPTDALILARSLDVDADLPPRL